MTKRLLLMLCGITLLAFVGCASTNQNKPTAIKENAILIDVRNPDEFKNGHLEGAINVPQADIETIISSIVPDKAAPVYVYCRGGREATMAAEKLKSLGYSDIHNLGAMKNAQEQLGRPFRQ